MTRRPYLDWLRGIAVLIMIEGHTLDSWTRTADRQSPWYQWAIVVAGYGAPIFLFADNTEGCAMNVVAKTHLSLCVASGLGKFGQAVCLPEFTPTSEADYSAAERCGRTQFWRGKWQV